MDVDMDLVGGADIGGASLLDFPSLRDLETSNLFSAINHNMSIKRYMDQNRKEILERINQRIDNAEKGWLTFRDVTRGASKGEATEMFMSLMIFS